MVCFLLERNTMKKIALVLVTITQVFTTFPAENVSFRDGTFFKADIYNEKGFEPDKNGVILSFGKKVYVHHYPSTRKSLAPPYFQNLGPNPYGMSTCVPSRISFFHFETFALAGMKEDIHKMSIPHEKKLGAIKAIEEAMSLAPPKAMTLPTLNNKRISEQWQTYAEIWLAYHFKKGNAVWGKKLETLKKYDLMDKSKILTKK